MSSATVRVTDILCSPGANFIARNRSPGSAGLAASLAISPTIRRHHKTLRDVLSGGAVPVGRSIPSLWL